MTLHRLQSVGYLTNWAARLLTRDIDKRLKDIGVSSGYLPVFFHLAKGEEVTQKALVRLAAIEQPTMAATLSRMERNGLIQRRPDPSDGRIQLISLTPLALEKAAEVEEATAALNAAALAGLKDEEAEALRVLLKRVIRNLGADIDETADEPT